MAPALAVGASVASVTNRVAGRSRKANAAATPTPDCARPDGDQRPALPSFRLPKIRQAEGGTGFRRRILPARMGPEYSRGLEGQLEYEREMRHIAQ